jgi:uncharacterized protein
LFFALLAVLAFWALRGYWRAQERRRAQDRANAPAPAGEDMVRCAHCGVHLPESEGIRSEEGCFCSDEHRRLHARR